MATSTTRVNSHIETTSTPVLLNSAYELMGMVEIQLTQRSHIQHQNLAGQVTKVEFHPVSSYWFPFYLPLSVLLQSPQWCYLSILNVLFDSYLELELCINLARKITDFVFNYARGSLGFFIKADVEVARVEVVNDDDEEEEMQLSMMMESLNFVRKMGASKSAIDKLKKERKVDIDSDGELLGTCIVCLEELLNVVELIKMPCSHLFHELCICRWLEEKNSCPICRCEINDDD